jgi:hypothetical protein
MLHPRCHVPWRDHHWHRVHALSVRLVCGSGCIPDGDICCPDQSGGLPSVRGVLFGFLMASMDVVLWARLLTNLHHPADGSAQTSSPGAGSATTSLPTDGSAPTSLPTDGSARRHLSPTDGSAQTSSPGSASTQTSSPNGWQHTDIVSRHFLVKGSMSLQWYLLWVYLEPCAIYFDQAHSKIRPGIPSHPHITPFAL